MCSFRPWDRRSIKAVLACEAFELLQDQLAMTNEWRTPRQSRVQDKLKEHEGKLYVVCMHSV